MLLLCDQRLSGHDSNLIVAQGLAAFEGGLSGVVEVSIPTRRDSDRIAIYVNIEYWHKLYPVASPIPRELPAPGTPVRSRY